MKCPNCKKEWIGEFQYDRGKCTKSSCEYHDRLMEGNCAGSYKDGALLPCCQFWTGRKMQKKQNHGGYQPMDTGCKGTPPIEE